MNMRATRPSIAEQAAEWLIGFEDAEQAPRLSEFTGWLKASPQHVEEFLLVAAAWGHFDGMDAERKLAIDEIVAAASLNVVAMEAPAARTVPLTFSHLRKGDDQRRKQWSVAAAIAGAAILAGVLISNQHARQNYSTAAGEQRTVKLDDGSIVHLNARSQLQVRYTNEVRELRLVEGEALFAVEKDRVRPFRVLAGETLIQAVGTQFNVYKRARETRIAVLEGAIRISNDPALLSAGQSAKIAPGGQVHKQTTINIADATAWRERRLVFRDDTLADIVGEFNRYNDKYPLELAIDADRNLRLTGVFRADDPEALLLYLTANTGLKVERRSDGAMIRK